MVATATLPDERAFHADIEAGAFQLGVCMGKWRLVETHWPIAYIAVAASCRDGAPQEFCFRFDCSGFPSAAPTAMLWDYECKQALAVARWPNGASRVPAVFRPDWKEGSCLYLPCDRVSIEGHHNWPSEYPSLQWSPTRGIAMYLEEIHSLLNSSDYKGVRGG